MGFGGMEDMDAMVYGGDDDDDDLEAELAALTGDVSESKKVSPKKKGQFLSLCKIAYLYNEMQNYKIINYKPFILIFKICV